jgi:hypothetical protein
MSDNPETQYYQSVVDDMTVTVERLNSDLGACREEIKELRRIVALASLYIGSFQEDSNLDEGALLLDLDRHIKTYHQQKKEGK